MTGHEIVVDQTVEMPRGFSLAEKIQEGGVECDEIWTVLCNLEGKRAYRYQVIEWYPADRMMCNAHYFHLYKHAEADFNRRVRK